jgi:pyruvate dehydrogenase E2 component (dihydrolipoamide acetyltransferase)
VITEGPDESYDLDQLSVDPGDAEPSAPGPAAAEPAAAPVARSGGRVKASPAARKRARQLGVDLESVVGTGPGGRITTEDVEAASSGAAPAAATPAGPVPLSRIRKAIGKAMSTSKATIPHFYLDIDVDMTDAEIWRKEVGAGELSATDLVVKAAAQALAQMPGLNASLSGSDAVEVHTRVHIGLAVGTDEGLLVPVIEHANTKSLRVLAQERREIVEAARSGRMRSGERATFTVSNLGMFGVTSFTAVINPPEAAILALGAILPQVRAGDDGLSISIRRMMNATLSADHRLTDGVAGARFLAAFKAALESRETLEGWL